MNTPQKQEWRALDQFNPAIFQQNILLLTKYHPELYKKFEPVFTHNNLQILQTSNIFFQIKEIPTSIVSHSTDVTALQQDRSRVEAMIAKIKPKPETSLFFILGLDLGFTLYALHSSIAQSPLTAFIIIEPDERFAAASFMAANLSPFLQSNRIEFVIGQDFEEQLDRLFSGKNYFAATDITVLPSTSANQPAYALYWKRLRQSVQNLQAKYRNQFLNEIKKVTDFYAHKPFKPIQSILSLVQSQGLAVRFIQQRFLQECTKNGIHIVEYQPGFANEVGIIRALEQHKPDGLIFINRSPGEYVDSAILNSIRVPRMVWCVDDPNSFIKEPFCAQDIVFSWDMSYSGDMKKLGAVHVDHFPYMADLDNAIPKKRPEFKSPVSYIGQVKAFDPVELGLDEKTAALVKQVGEEKFRFPQQTYQSLIVEYQRHFGLHLIEQEEEPVPRFVRYGIYLIANALRRIAVLEAAMPFGLKLYGSKDWLHILGGHPLRQCYQGEADPMVDVPDIFVSSAVNLNIHSLQALSSMNQRDFNCPLVGGFLLTDWVEQADQYFKPDHEMIFYHSIEDVTQKIEHYLNHDDERQQIIQKGRERVLKDHTYEARVPGIIKTLNRRIKEQMY